MMDIVATRLRAAIGLAALCTLGAVDAASAQPACKTPDGYFAAEAPLPRSTAALAAGRSFAIAVIGGASTEGQAAGDPARSWPQRLAAALRTRHPGIDLKLVVLAQRGSTAREMLVRLDEALASRPDLVVWETGTADAVRGGDLDTFRDTLQQGLDRLRAARVDAMLMDMQFSRRSRNMIGFDRYRAVMREVANQNGVPLFRRHDLMREWAENGALDYGVRGPDRTRAVATRLYDCIGRAVAELVAQGGTPRP